MATINIGNLTFTHKGDYAGGTAYVKNDIVYYATNGNSYIAKGSTTGNVPTSTAHWDLFVAGSSGIWNAGLSLGSASQSLRVNSGGTALEFYTPTAGGLIQRVETENTSISRSGTDGSWVDITGSAVTRALGGGQGQQGNTGTSGSANTGTGGRGTGGSSNAGSGGSGVVILRYSNTLTITVGSGLTSSTSTDGSDKITTFTAGTDTVSFA